MSSLEVQSVLLGLPAYNEATSMSSLLKKVQELALNLNGKLQVVLFDDGSTDNTAGVFLSECRSRNIAATVIGDGLNHGLGYGLRSILEYFLKNSDCEYLSIMDCDDTHHPEQIVQMLLMAKNKNLDVVIASRYQKGSITNGVSGVRKLISSLAGVYLRILFPFSHVRDFTCGFRLYNKKSLQKLYSISDGKFFRRDGFSCMPEILIRLYLSKSHIGEVPMELAYDRKTSASKMKFLKNMREVLMLGIRLRFNLDKA